MTLMTTLKKNLSHYKSKYLPLQILVFCSCIKRGTSLGCIVAVSSYFSIGEAELQEGEQGFESFLLIVRACVFWSLAVGRQSAYVAYANRCSVVSLAMRSHLFYRSSLVHAAISIHHEMVANVAKSLLTVPAVYVADGKVFTFGSGCAMNDY